MASQVASSSLFSSHGGDAFPAFLSSILSPLELLTPVASLKGLYESDKDNSYRHTFARGNQRLEIQSLQEKEERRTINPNLYQYAPGPSIKRPHFLKKDKR
ncbi:hypothetical protein V6N11_050243 [Hibiscus sabdariffa]|uniref:Uncharacterized protein n=2 Tax=Hibiscus sabdariffa TaxID=183260 RepID=A0ABR2T998_9ROSI